MEFTPNSYSSKWPRTPIYRLGFRMGVRQNLPGSRPDGGPWPSGRTTVRQDFPKFSRRNLSCIRTSSERDGSIVRTDARPRQVISITGFARPDGFTSTRNFYIWCACVRTMRGRRPDGWSRIGSYHIRTVHFELRFLPYGDTRPDGIPHRPDGWLIFPFLNLERISEPFENW
jgi:hypothetical protein